ncbi:MAG: carbohydrate ABC transporter substrate-binding protein, partial [Acetobacteraceae bacterium]|nr:carbohydrate ABC transporter substrate-binding protein [Acetobacteraceae bacterium]
MTRSALTRRQVLAGSTLAATALPIVHVSAQGSAGRVACGFWDHWVPVGNNTMREMCAAWGAKEKVDVQVDFITSVGNQILLTIAAEAQSRSGHDILSFPTWEPGNNADHLEPVDDVMGRLTAKYGEVSPAAAYLGRRSGKWVAVPAVAGTQQKPCLGRIDLLQQHAGLNPQVMWPAENHAGPGADGWNWDAFLVAAEKCHKAGHPFGLPMGQQSDAVDWVGACLASFGAHMLDQEGKITVSGNAKLRSALEYLVKLAKFLPDDVWAWDDGSNNRAIQSGRSALIFNPPSAYAVAKRDNMAGFDKQWTFPMPSGPAGRFVPYLPYFWG